jgi:hypothetical protein
MSAARFDRRTHGDDEGIRSGFRDARRCQARVLALFTLSIDAAAPQARSAAGIAPEFTTVMPR